MPRQIDIVFVILAVSLLCGLTVITMRSSTISLGYEIAKEKSQEKFLYNHKVSLEATYAALRHDTLQTSLGGAAPAYHFPDKDHIIISHAN